MCCKPITQHLKQLARPLKSSIYTMPSIICNDTGLNQLQSELLYISWS